MDKVLKQRLIGASILIALAVIFVPMFFDGPEQQQLSRELSIDLPMPPDDRGPARRLPLDPDRGRGTTPEVRTQPPMRGQQPYQSVPMAEGKENGRPPEEDQAGADELMAQIEASQERIRSLPPESLESQGDDPGDIESSTETGAPETSSAPAPGSAAVAATDDEVGPVTSPPEAGNQASSGWMVQVASFSSPSNADEVVEQLTRLGHVASIDQLVRGQSELHRVRTGPYARRNEAERALEQIRQTVAGVSPVVTGGSGIELPTAPDESGYAVQVGSFASRDNALRLLDQLEGLDYEAFIHQDVAGSRAIWRVRVGPLGSREQAQERLAELIERSGIDGLVVSHP